MIKDLEQNLKCAGMCEIPHFWFYQEFFNGPPTQSCLSSMKNELDKVSGALGYSYTAMALSTILQIFSLCGICKAKDACFQDNR
jgi:hypothetical protein